MLHFIQQILPQALVLSLLQSLWQALLIWVIVKLAERIVPLSGHTRYYLNAAGALAPVLLFIVTFTSALASSAGAVAVGNAMPIAAATGGTLSDSAWLVWLQIPSILAPYVAAAYLFTLLLLSTRFSGAVMHSHGLRQSPGKKAPVDYRLLVEHYSAVLSIGRKVQVFVSHKVLVPFTIGYLKPMILLPAAMVNNISLQQAEAILLHELIHIRRYDYLVNIGLEIASIVLFFNPFVKKMVMEARVMREVSCDDAVMQFKIDKRAYAEALLSCSQIQSTTLALAASGDSSFQLLHRIRRIMAGHEAKRSPRMLTWIPAFAFFLAFGLIAVGAQFFSPERDGGKNNGKQASHAKTQPMYFIGGLSTPVNHMVDFTTAALKSSPVAELSVQQSLRNMMLLYNAGWDIFEQSTYTANTTVLKQPIEMAPYPEDLVAISQKVPTEESAENVNTAKYLSAGTAYTEIPYPNYPDDARELNRYEWHFQNDGAAAKIANEKEKAKDRFRLIAPKIVNGNAKPNVVVVAPSDNVSAPSSPAVSINGFDFAWVTDEVIVMQEEEVEKLLALQEKQVLQAFINLEKHTKLLEERLHGLSQKDLEKAENYIVAELAKVEAASKKVLELKGKIRVRTNKGAVVPWGQDEDHQPSEKEPGEADNEQDPPVILKHNSKCGNQSLPMPAVKQGRVTISVTL